MTELARIRIYPVKALDGENVESARVTGAGLLAHDREYALFGPDGEPVNGKRTARFHDVDGEFDVERGRLTVRGDDEVRTFDLPDERAAAEEWFSAFLDRDVTVERDVERGFVDRQDAGRPCLFERNRIDYHSVSKSYYYRVYFTK